MDKEPKFGAAIFFDNDLRRIAEVREFCENIRLVSINEMKELHAYPFSDGILEDYIDTLDYNVYLEAIQHLGVVSDMLDPLSGIEDEHIATFDAWLEETKAVPNRVALFDWDRTITVIEGFFPENLADIVKWRNDNEVTLKDWREDTLIYLCGGNERLAKLRAMFVRGHAAGVKNIVLTNNGLCTSSIFTDLAQHLFHPVPVDAICGKLYNFHKGQALRAHPQFAELCAVRGGKRSGKSSGKSSRKCGRGKSVRKERRTRKRLRNCASH